mmetsp:Transcript_69409/g.206774  ORF Transcript_69409/g.206774 Transcript_69409/m.206774 type:complete len:354 (+) Transcript_69409:49-1110(+)
MAAPADGNSVPPALAAKLAGLEASKVKSTAGIIGLQDPNLRSLQPYELSETLRPVVERLGMRRNLEEMQEHGYTVLKDCFSREDCDAMVAAIKRVGASNHMLRKAGEEVFDAVVVHEKLYAMAEYMVGKGCQLSQLAATILEPQKGHRGKPKVGLHADQNWTPAPFPEHNQLLTGCVVLSDDFTLENGATCVVPGSHRLRRHPNLVEQSHCAELVEPIVAKRGDIACWDGSVWHTPGVRQNAGQRLILHVTYCRVFMTPLENYHHIPESTIGSKPYAPLLRRLIGRGSEMRGMFNLKAPGRDMLQFARLTEMARGTYDGPAFDEKAKEIKAAMSRMQERQSAEAAREVPRSKL